MKTTSPHEGNLRAERKRFSWAQFFLCLVETLAGAMRHNEET